VLVLVLVLENGGASFRRRLNDCGFDPIRLLTSSNTKSSSTRTSTSIRTIRVADPPKKLTLAESLGDRYCPVPRELDLYGAVR
jgi:hypothetical protein